MLVPSNQPRGGLLRVNKERRVERLDKQRPLLVERFYGSALRGFCENHPCIGARSVAVNGNLFFSVYPDMQFLSSALLALRDLELYLQVSDPIDDVVKTLAMVFTEPVTSPADFAAKYWKFAQLLHDIDCLTNEYDPMASSDPSAHTFELSLAGRAIFTTTLNPAHPRAARHALVPIWVCNQTRQFNTLRATGQFEMWKKQIRDADSRLDPSGTPNPVLADHGYESAAQQLAGWPINPVPFVARRTFNDKRSAWEALMVRAKDERLADRLIVELEVRGNKLESDQKK